MRVLGIETTCDETAAAVVEAVPGRPGEILSNEVMSQIAEHAAFGGVVPEIAARAHIETLDRLIERALDQAGVELKDLDGIAGAAGPGLIGGVIVGLTMAKAWRSPPASPLSPSITLKPMHSPPGSPTRSPSLISCFLLRAAPRTSPLLKASVIMSNLARPSEMRRARLSIRWESSWGCPTPGGRRSKSLRQAAMWRASISPGPCLGGRCRIFPSLASKRQCGKRLSASSR